jgi:hypothetical protein
MELAFTVNISTASSVVFWALNFEGLSIQCGFFVDNNTFWPIREAQDVER